MTATNDNAWQEADDNLPVDPNLLALRDKIDMIGQNIAILMHNFNRSTGPAADDVLDQNKPAARAIDLYCHRRRRVKWFGPDLFGEPAWDILLDLFIAIETGKQISVTSACIGAAVPLTTALRWLSMLEARGLIMREHDERDARRSYVRLSDQGREMMAQYLSDS